MAKQTAGLCRLEGTFDQLVFYKMDGKYYVRVKSSLSSKRVKTSPEFKWTMIYAKLLGRASKIGSQVYKALPPGWRQFWMYRSFTGEAFTLLKKNPYTDEQVKQILWKCYVEYWEQMKALDPGNPIWQPKPEKIRKRRVYTLEALMRKRDKYGKPKYPHLIKAEKERIAREQKEAWIKTLEEKKQQAALAQSLPAINQVAIPGQSEILIPMAIGTTSEITSTWQVANDGRLHTEESHVGIDQTVAPEESEILLPVAIGTKLEISPPLLLSIPPPAVPIA